MVVSEKCDDVVHIAVYSMISDVNRSTPLASHGQTLTVPGVGLWLISVGTPHSTPPLLFLSHCAQAFLLVWGD